MEGESVLTLERGCLGLGGWAHSHYVERDCSGVEQDPLVVPSPTQADPPLPGRGPKSGNQGSRGQSLRLCRTAFCSSGPWQPEKGEPTSSTTEAPGITTGKTQAEAPLFLVAHSPEGPESVRVGLEPLP